MERGEQPYAGDERALLLQWLAFQRATLAGKCDGLAIADIDRQSAPPSTLSLGRIVRHLGDMENIDACILSGEPIVSLYEPATAGDSEPEADPEAEGEPEGGMYDWSLYDVGDDALDVWSQQCRRLDGVVATFGSLDDRAPGDFGALTVRSVLLALVMEYARHNGHADLLRERIDGRVGY